MNFEDLEQNRSILAAKVMTSLTEIVEDKKQDTGDRIKAAKVFNNMSDSIIQAHLASNSLGAAENATKKLISSVDKLGKDRDV